MTCIPINYAVRLEGITKSYVSKDKNEDKYLTKNMCFRFRFKLVQVPRCWSA